MFRTAFAVPELPGKDARSIPAFVKSRFDEYVRSRKRHSIALERVYRMETPMGAFAIAYIESGRPFAEVNAALIASPDAFDKEFLRRLGDVHGFDPTKMPPGAGPEVLAEWIDPNVHERGRGLAFVAPVAPGRSEAGRAFARTAFHDRQKELAASRRAKHLNAEVVVLNQTPNGEIVCVYIEGKDPVAGNREFAASKDPFDVWFKGECKKIFPPVMDFDRPLPPIEQIHDWRASS